MRFRRIGALILLSAFGFNAASGAVPELSAPQKVSRAAWVANALLKVNRDHDYNTLALLKYASAHIETVPGATAEGLQKTLLSLAAEQKQLKELAVDGYKLPQNFNDAVDSLALILSRRPESAAVVPLLKDSTKWAAKYLPGVISPDAQVMAQGELYSDYRHIQDEQNQQQVLEGVWNAALESKALRDAINRNFAERLNATTENTAKEIFEKNHDLLADQAIAKIAKLDDLSLDDLKVLARDEVRMLNDLSTGIAAVMQMADLVKRGTLDAQKAAEDAERRRAGEQLRIDAAKSGVYLLSTFVGFKNKDLGRALGVTGTSTIAVAEAISRFKSAALTPNKGLGTIMLAGNFMSAALNLFSLFGGPSGPTTDEIILEQIGQIRKEIADLGKQMNERFDRIDQALNQIYSTMLSRFSDIEGYLREQRKDISDLRFQVLGISNALNGVDKNLSSMLSAGFRRKFKSELSECRDSGLDFASRTNDYLNFIRCSELFKSTATSEATDDLAVAPERQNLADPFFGESLLEHPERYFNFLSRFGTNELGGFFGRNTASDRVIANPVEWSAGAEAYLEMLSQNWETFGPLSSINVTEAIRARGLELNKFIGAITSTSDGKGGKIANHELLAAAAERYRAALSAFGKFVAQTQADTEQDMGGFPLWADIATADVTPPLPKQLLPCPGGFADVYGPTFIQRKVAMPAGVERYVPRIYRIAAQLGLGQLNVCVNHIGYIGDPPVGHVYVMLGVFFNEGMISHYQLILPVVIDWKNFNSGPSSPADSLISAMGPAGQNIGNPDGSVVVLDAIERGFKNDNLGPAGRKARGEEVTKRVEERINRMRQSFFQALYPHFKVPSTATGSGLTAISTSRAILLSYLKLGMSKSFVQNDELHALFSGSDHLPDAEDIQNALNGQNAASFIQKFDLDAKTKLDRLAAVIDGILDNGRFNEPLAAVNQTMVRLDSALEMQKATCPKEPIGVVYKKLRAALAR